MYAQRYSYPSGSAYCLAKSNPQALYSAQKLGSSVVVAAAAAAAAVVAAVS